MKKVDIIEHHADTIKQGFDSSFSKRILNGRSPITADLCPRSYPYTDLIKMYSAGVLMGVDICIKEQEK